MKRLLVALLFMLLGSTSLLAQYEWVTSVTATPNGSRMESFGYSAYVDQYGNDAWGWISGSHCISGLVYCDSFEVFHAEYSGYWNLLTDPGCYNVDIQSDFLPFIPWEAGSHDYKSVTGCTLNPLYDVSVCTMVDGSFTQLRVEHYQQGTTVQYSPITPPEYQFCGWSGFVNSSEWTITFHMPGQNIEQCANFTFVGGGSGDTYSGGDNEGLPCFPGIDVNCYSSPVIINLGKGDYRLTGSNAPVLFDMAGNGHPRAMGWTAAGADEAFLWLDRNHNGRVTSGAELFGNFTPLQNGQLAKNGFEALRELDTNGDGVIDERDAIWSRLMLWKDLNHNGISEQNEILPIAGSGVISIDLHDHWSGRRDTSGNLFKYESLVSITSGPGKGIQKHPVYDIFFAYVPYVP